LLDSQFMFAIESAGSFVEDEERGLAKQCARQGQTLALSAREPNTAFSDNGFQPFRERCDNTTESEQMAQAAAPPAVLQGTPRSAWP
jgi:hypothetical protein